MCWTKVCEVASKVKGLVELTQSIAGRTSVSCNFDERQETTELTSRDIDHEPAIRSTVLGRLEKSDTLTTSSGTSCGREYASVSSQHDSKVGGDSLSTNRLSLLDELAAASIRLNESSVTSRTTAKGWSK